MREEESGDEKGRKGGSLSLSLSTFSFSHSACWCTGVAGVIVRNMRVCVQTALNKSRPLSMAPETDGAGCCCLSDENNRERSRGAGRDQPSVLSLRLASSWDDFVSLETEVCGKGEGIGVFFFFFEDEWVGSYQARSCKRSDEVSVELQVPLPG